MPSADIEMTEITSESSAEERGQIAALLTEHLKQGGGEATDSDVSAALEHALESPGRVSVFGFRKAGGELIGVCFANRCCGIESGGDYLWINEMFIHADYRSQGMGARALELVTEWAAAQGCRRAVAWTGKSNTISQRLFGSAGFAMHEVVALDKRLD